MIKTAFKTQFSQVPKVSFILLDWGCRESFHSLDYLANQTVPRSEYEIMWIEYYGRRAEGLDAKIKEHVESDRPPPVDQWLIMGMPDPLYYHKHLMYNVGIARARGDILIICDSDAMFTPRFVETVIEEYARDPNIVLHFDEVRNSRQDFYPFNFPPFETLTGEGAINWRDGKTTGLWEEEDPLHVLNYGACMCAKRSDLIAIGGSDEHMDYLGHVCGPYELTFRLVNKGLREVWHESEFLYHTWHPGSDGDFNYIGPSDGRHMSTTSLETRENGRIMPLVENPVIRHERETGTTLGDEALIDPAYLAAWTQEEVAKSPRFTLFKRGQGGTKLEREGDTYNILSHNGAYYGVPHELGPMDMAKAADRDHPRVVKGDTLDAVEALMRDGAQPPMVHTLPPQLVASSGGYNIVLVDGAHLAIPTTVGNLDLSNPANREHPEILRASTRDEVEALVRARRLERLEVDGGRRERELNRLRDEVSDKEAAVAVAHGLVEDARAELRALVARGAAWETERQTWGAERQTWETERQAWKAERQTWEAERQAWKAERQTWETELQAWKAERADLTQAFFNLRLHGDGAPLLETFTIGEAVQATVGGVEAMIGEPGGVMLRGPGVPLGGGHYELSFRCALEEVTTREAPLVTVEFVYRGHTVSRMDFLQDQLQDGRGACSFLINTPPTTLNPDLSFQLRHHGRAKLRVTGGTLRLLEEPRG